MTGVSDATERARQRVKQLRGLAAEIEPSTPEADAVMRGYLDDADLLGALAAELEAARLMHETMGVIRRHDGVEMT